MNEVKGQAEIAGLPRTMHTRDHTGGNHLGVGEWHLLTAYRNQEKSPRSFRIRSTPAHIQHQIPVCNKRPHNQPELRSMSPVMIQGTTIHASSFGVDHLSFGTSNHTVSACGMHSVLGRDYQFPHDEVEGFRNGGEYGSKPENDASEKTDHQQRSKPYK